MSDPCCYKCGRRLTFDEVGIHKKLVNRGADSFMCLTCLAGHFKVTEESLNKQIEHFREQGCTLFSSKKQ